MPTGPVLHPWRRLLRLSVRGLIIVVLLTGAGFGWIVREARIQRDAVAAIRMAGGAVRYDGEWSAGTSIPGGKLRATSRLVDLVGVDYFGHVTVVAFAGYTPTDATLAQIGRLTRLQELYVCSYSVSDAGLAHLSRR